MLTLPGPRMSNSLPKSGGAGEACEERNLDEEVEDCSSADSVRRNSLENAAVTETEVASARVTCPMKAIFEEGPTVLLVDGEIEGER